MAFSAKQLKALKRSLNPAYVRTRQANGRELSYLEGWHVIAEANRIFGFDGWDRETVEQRCVLTREIRGSFYSAYIAKVRVSVHTDGRTVVREGHGTGEGRGATPGEAHDTALKAAETDATKRALATFGKQFGLSLYGNGNGVERHEREAARPALPARAVQNARGVMNGREPLPSMSQVLKEVMEPLSAPEAKPMNGATAAEPAAMSDGVILAATEPLEATGQPGVQCGPELIRPLGVDKSELTIGVPRRLRDRVHLKYITTQPCLICGRKPADAHHLRFAQPRAIGMKVSDEFTVPLCRLHHREVHDAGNEAAYWNDLEIDALEIAKGLWDESLQKRRGRPAEPKPA